MNTQIEAMHFYTKLLTGMILLLNIGLLVSIRLALKYARHSSLVDRSEAGTKLWNSAKRALTVLIITVVCMNGAAVYANHRMIGATREIAAELPNSGQSAIGLSHSRPQ
jgi:hypothetical protein